MSLKTSVIIENVLDLPVLKMSWTRDLQVQDLISAYSEILIHLNSAKQPLDVVVDLRSFSELPVYERVSELLEGVYTHQMLGKWLVIGSDGLAQVTSKILFGLKGEQKILWFRELEDANDYLQASHLLNSI